MINLALIIPCYNEEAMLRPSNTGDSFGLFVDAVEKVVFPNDVQIQYIFVDDGSSDGTLRCLKDLSARNKNIHYVSFSRNFGKESAMFAGFEKALRLQPYVDFVAVMDADLQDPPQLLPEMLSILLESKDYDCVATRRVTRKGEPVIRSFFARRFYKLINRISSTEIVDGARDYRLMPRKMVEAIVSIKEVNRFSKGLFSWVGFKTKWLEYENIERAAGETKWSFWKLFKYSIDGIVSFSTVPLQIASVAGVITCICAFVYLMVVFIKTIVFGEHVSGYPSLMCVILFLGGIQLVSIGIIGQYLSKAYLEVKKRPIYIIKDEN